MNTLTLSQVKVLFNDFLNITVVNGALTQAFLQFPKGTKEVIVMHWLEEQNYKFSIADYLMSNDFVEKFKEDINPVKIIP